MRVLSLFDGMSCGRIALERAGIRVDAYYASEVDKYAMTVSIANYPDIVQIGDVRRVDAKGLGKIDLLIGGSPCQSFSFAGKRKGMATACNVEILSLGHYLELKGSGFEFAGQSYLFWEYMRVLEELREINPGVLFLLENVEMGSKWEMVLSKAIGVNGIHINSALVSAQNRKRIYWTNIGMVPMGLFGDLGSIIEQPKDRGILLRDVLEGEVDEKYYLSERLLAGMLKQNSKNEARGNGFYFQPKKIDEKGNAITNPSKMRVDDNFIVHNLMPRSGDPKKGGTGHLSRNDGKTYCLDTGNTNAIEIVGKYHKEITDSLANEKATTIDASYYKGFGVRSGACRQVVEVVVMRGRNPDNPKSRKPGLKTEQRLEANGTGKTNSLITVQKDNLVIHQRGRGFNKGGEHIEKSPPLTSNSWEYNNTLKIRRLTPLECERLQTVPDNYTNYVSDSQRYKMLGNGWTIEVIAHIFSYINF